MLEFLRPNVANGLSSVLLFGVPEKVEKRDDGQAGETEDNPVMEAVRRIKKEFPSLTVACDVCLCPYTSHGHCGVLNDGELNLYVLNYWVRAECRNLLSQEKLYALRLI